MSRGNQSIDFNGKYQYVIFYKYPDNEERVCGVYDTLRHLKLGINNLDKFFSNNGKYIIKKIYIKPELVIITQGEGVEIQEYIDKQIEDMNESNARRNIKRYFNIEIN